MGASLSILKLQYFPLLSYGLVILETKFPSVAFSSSQERQLQCTAMLLQQTKFKSLLTRLARRSHHSSHYNHDTKFDVTGARVNLEILFHTTEKIPRKKFMEMGLVEGEAPTRMTASFFQTSGELVADTANTNNQAQSARLRMTGPKIIPSLLRVFSANYFFSPSNSPGILTEKSLMSVSEVATGWGHPLSCLKNKKVNYLQLNKLVIKSKCQIGTAQPRKVYRDQQCK